MNNHHHHQIDSLPQEIINDIFSRLPLKSLALLKLVRKSWNHLINNSQFLKLHINQTVQANNNVSIMLALKFDTISNNGKLLSVELPINGAAPIFEAISVQKISKSIVGNKLKISGSCNGLLFLTSDISIDYNDLFLLWNPTTRHFLELPSCPNNYNDKRCIRANLTLGFGYDLDEDDYKVIKSCNYHIVASDEDANGTVVTEITVYSLGSNTWRSVREGKEVFPYIVFDTGKYVNGAVYWLGVYQTCYPNGWKRVVRFDFGSEEFGEVPLPPPDQFFNMQKGVSLAVSKDHLYMTGADNVGRVHILVLEEYDQQWCKLCSIPEHVPNGSLSGYKLLCFSEDGKYIFQGEHQERLVIYDPVHQTVEKIEVKGVSSWLSRWGFRAEAYIRSLVPLKHEKKSSLNSYHFIF